MFKNIFFGKVGVAMFESELKLLLISELCCIYWVILRRNSRRSLIWLRKKSLWLILKKDDDPKDIASIAKALFAATTELKTIRSEINGIKTGKVTESRLQSLNEKLKER